MASANDATSAEMTHIVTVETANSDSSSVSVKLLCDEVAIVAASVDPFEDYSICMNIWQEPFDYAMLPQSISLELIKRCPFLVGSDRARYTALFFSKTAGLCARGLQWQDLKNDALFPREDLTGTYPTSERGNRHPLKLIRDRQTAIDALHMYQRVYGYSQPHNGEFGTSFIRGLALFYQHNQNVNWAEKAAQLASDCVKRHPHKKLTPPSIREQIQAMINLFTHYLKDAYRRTGCTCKQGSYAPPVPKPLLVGEAGLQRKRSCNLVRRADFPAVEHSARRAQIQFKEAKDRLIQLQQEEKVAMLWSEQQLSAYQDRAAAEQEWKGQQINFLRLAKASQVEDVAKKAHFCEVVGAKTHEAHAPFAAIGEIVSVLLNHSDADLQGCAVVMEELTLDLERKKADIEAVLAKNNNIRLPAKRSMDDASTSVSVDSHPLHCKVYSRRSKHLKN